MQIIVRYGKPDKALLDKQAYEYLVRIVGEREARRTVYGK